MLKGGNFFAEAKTTEFFTEDSTVKNSVNIGIIGAMEEEVAHLKNIMQLEETIKKAAFTFFKGKLFGEDIVVVKSGIGKVAAAICTQILIDSFSPKFIINSGIAGALSDELEIGDVIAGKNVSYHDVDVTAFGYEKNQLPGMKNIDFGSDELLLSEAINLGAKLGKVTTGDIFVADKETKNRIQHETKASCVEMESAAIAHVCTLNEVSFIIIRSISDKAGETAEVDFKVNIEKAVESAIKITEGIIKNVKL
ncbi:MAG: 5'-methylthioadenosine/adenosylhomocysteine nucleosidase [Defluviitaleaceae bacterium]|nr:5'-methylthioadenosine/adenosylhomocysteine nucleosidase [Defluviitaleaceae bacterium]